MQEYRTRALTRNTDIHALHYGLASEIVAQIVTDIRWPGIWRILWPDGRLSDIVNLARAKDAAATIAERGPPARNRRRLHWKKERSKTGLAASPIVPRKGGAT